MCHRIEDDYQHLAHDYLNVDDVVIARVDSSKNEIKDIVPADFPMIVLYKAGGDGESQALFKADQITYNGLKQFVEKNRVVVNLPKKIESAEPKEEAAKEEAKEASKEEAKKEEVKEEPVEIDVEEVCLGPDGPCSVEVDEVIIEEPKQKSKEEPKKEEPKQKASKEEPKKEAKEATKEKPAKKVDEGVCSGSGDSCSIDPEEEEIIEEIEEEIEEVVEEMEKEELEEKKEKPAKNYHFFSECMHHYRFFCQTILQNLYNQLSNYRRMDPLN